MIVNSKSLLESDLHRNHYPNSLEFKFELSTIQFWTPSCLCLNCNNCDTMKAQVQKGIWVWQRGIKSSNLLSVIYYFRRLDWLELFNQSKLNQNWIKMKSKLDFIWKSDPNLLSESRLSQWNLLKHFKICPIYSKTDKKDRIKLFKQKISTLKWPFNQIILNKTGMDRFKDCCKA